MNLSEGYIKRIKRLSGIRLDEIELKATSGRSEKGTLGFYVEEYLLNLGEMVLNSLVSELKQTGVMSLNLDTNSIRISQNSILMKFGVKNDSNPDDVSKTEYTLNIIVNLEQSSNTVAMLKYSNLNDEFNLQSKHSSSDLEDFIGEISKRVINVQKTAG